ncbi:Tripartite DNA replication factor [Cichlidogyrus casuarinus]|uniref:Tripartite DNA replication factor n=1 Tax=Cichlidogyrus casuarinus TaxID=1844966 RepID=A0ABD2QEN3_9PLAT
MVTGRAALGNMRVALSPGKASIKRGSKSSKRVSSFVAKQRDAVLQRQISQGKTPTVLDCHGNYDGFNYAPAEQMVDPQYAVRKSGIGSRAQKMVSLAQNGQKSRSSDRKRDNSLLNESLDDFDISPRPVTRRKTTQLPKTPSLDAKDDDFINQLCANTKKISTPKKILTAKKTVGRIPSPHKEVDQPMNDSLIDHLLEIREPLDKKNVCEISLSGFSDCFETSRESGRLPYHRLKVVKVTELSSSRYLVEAVDDTVEGEEQPYRIELRDSWSECTPQLGSIVNILTNKELRREEPRILFDDFSINKSSDDLFIPDLMILNPDWLITGTTVVESMTCPRRTVLRYYWPNGGDLDTPVDPSSDVDTFRGPRVMLIGIVVHELFQRLLRISSKPSKTDAQAIIADCTSTLQIHRDVLV